MVSSQRDKERRKKGIYMKEFKVSMTAVLVFCVIVLSCAQIGASASELEEYYPKLVVVQHIETGRELDVVSCQDRHGEMWVFYSDIGDYDVGDILILMMWNNGENVYQHEIVEVYWEGYTKNMSQFMKVADWREQR